MKIGYFDCFAGVAGDMWVGALIDCGVSVRDLDLAVASLELQGVEISADSVVRGGLRGTLFQVAVDPATARSHRHLDDILARIGRAELPGQVTERAQSVFRRLGEVEAAVHGMSIEQVHFHEVGADDTIVDIVCGCLAVHLLGLERVYSSAVAVGSGTVECAHGTMPVPAPATLGNLLGVPVCSGTVRGEATTPTGAALLKTFVSEFEPTLRWLPARCGYGAGQRDDSGVPNLLRLTIGEVTDTGAFAQLWELSCNLDTATGEDLGHLLAGLRNRGAVDAFATAIQMKKGRPGYCITALVEAAERDAMACHLLEESSSLGVRMHAVDRAVVERWQETITTDLGPVVCKVWRTPSGRVLRRAEDDEIARLVANSGGSRAQIIARLAAQWEA